jgi:hypothetical protein
VLDHHGRRVRRLAVAHFPPGHAAAYRSVARGVCPARVLLRGLLLRLDSEFCENDGAGWGYYMEPRGRAGAAERSVISGVVNEFLI